MNTTILKELPPTKGNQKGKPIFALLLLTILLCFCQGRIQAQNRNLTGKVTGEKGDALPGVTVLVKGTTNGTATDTDGISLTPSAWSVAQPL